MKRIIFYVCPHCGNVMQAERECQMICCGQALQPLQASVPDEKHMIALTKVEDEWYLQMPHEMRKEHYITFIACVGYDRVLTMRLYPEQDCAVRMPIMRSGKIVYYCNQHGLFEYIIKR